MAYTYSTFQTALAEMLATTTSDSNFTGILPSIIDYAEQRLYRELDLLSATQAQTATCTASIRELSLSSLAAYKNI